MRISYTVQNTYVIEVDMCYREADVCRSELLAEARSWGTLFAGVVGFLFKKKNYLADILQYISYDSMCGQHFSTLRRYKGESNWAQDGCNFTPYQVHRTKGNHKSQYTDR